MKLTLRLLLAVFIILPSGSKSQSFIKRKEPFIKAIGISGGLTIANQRWMMNAPPDYSQTQRLKYGFNGSFFLEMINHETFRWVSELQYNQKGCRVDLPDGQTTVTNGFNYVCWNNFLKIREEDLTFVPYFLIGPRLEYLLNYNVYNNLMPPGVVMPGGEFKQFNIGASAGAGIELLFTDPWVPLAEVHYNLSLNNAYVNPAENDWKARNRIWEIRLGLKYVFHEYEKCPPSVK